MAVTDGANYYGRYLKGPMRKGSEAEFSDSRLFDRLVRQAATRLENNPLHGSGFLVMGFTPESAATVREHLRDLGVACTGTCSDVRQLLDVAEMGTAFNGLVINIDAFGDVEDAIDRLLEFRVKAPKMIVVLVSGKVAADDFGPERRAIGDVTLRWPLGRQRLKQALHTGLRRAVDGRA